MSNVQAQRGGVANDDCDSATNLTMTPVCSYITATTAGATDSGIPEGGCGGNANDDVWFFVDPTIDFIVVRVQGSSGFDAVLEVWDVIDCVDGFMQCVNATGNGGVELIQFEDLIASDGLYIRVYHSGTSAPSTPTFQICVHGPVPNNDCTGAQNLPMTANCVPVPGDATHTDEDGAIGFNISCLGVNQHPDDVFYRFVATSPDAVITVDGGGNSTTGYDPRVWLLSGTCGANLLQACANSTGPGGTEELVFQGLSVGATYYIMLSHADPNGTPATRTFTICVQQQGGGIGIEEIGANGIGWQVVGSVRGAPVELELDRATSGSATIVVVDALGREVHREVHTALSEGRLNLAWSPATQGMHIIQLNTEGVQSAQKLIIP